MNTKPCIVHVSQFELSKITLKNLNKFKLSPTAKLVLLTLIDCYNPKNQEIYPKQQTIADQLGISLSSVKRAIKELANNGIIIYETKFTNRYKMTPKFFNQFNLTPSTVQNETKQSVNLIPHEQIKKHINNRPKILNFQTCPTPGIESTKKFLEKKEKIKRGSPLDFNKNQAIEYLNNLPVILQSSYFAEELRKKWNL